MRYRKTRAAFLAAAVAAATPALAEISFDLRLPDGSHTLNATPGAYQIELWAQLTGADTSHTNEQLSSTYGNVTSMQIGGGAMTFGGLSQGAPAAPFNNQTFSRNGSAADLNADGITDWGSSSTSISNTNYMFARGTGPIDAGGAYGRAVDAQTWEFKVATYTLNVNAASGTAEGETHLYASRPSGVSTSVPIIYVVYRIDGVTGDGASTRPLAGIYNQPNQGIVIRTAPAPQWNGTSSDYLTASNWSTGTIPTSTYRAQFGSVGGVVGVNLPPPTGYDLSRVDVGSVDLTSAATSNVVIQNSSAANDGMLVLNGVGGVALSNDSTSTLTLRNGTAGHKMGVYLNAPGVNVSQATGSIRIESTLSGSQGIRKTGRGALVLSAANDIRDTTVIERGSIVLAHPQALQRSTVDVETPNGLQLAVPEATIGGLTGWYGFDIGAASLTVDSYSSTTFRGAITGTGSVRKKGSGTLTLGADTPFAGNFFVDAGTLTLFGANSAWGSGRIYVNQGGSLTTRGKSSGGVTVNSGGRLQGTGATITASDFVLLAGAITHIEEANSGTKTVIASTGGITYGGTLEVSVLADLPGTSTTRSWQAFSIAGAHSGRFSSIVDANRQIDPSRFKFDYNTGWITVGDINTVFPVDPPEVPEPTTAAAVALLTLPALRRRR
ncbi:MAG TPA: autotransporter-associated beta strand repeat-containing protein [Tepidisphaeraceae bacterium]|jgi:autotransporter-associated beta strand protein